MNASRRFTTTSIAQNRSPLNDAKRGNDIPCSSNTININHQCQTLSSPPLPLKSCTSSQSEVEIHMQPLCYSKKCRAAKVQQKHALQPFGNHKALHGYRPLVTKTPPNLTAITVTSRAPHPSLTFSHRSKSRSEQLK